VKPRHVRMAGHLISARLGHRDVDVSNLSLTGALLVVDEALQLDSRSTLVLARESISVTINTQVIRSGPSDVSSRWLVAVIFLSLSDDARRQIPLLC
jgi:hypothetical protein